MISAGSAAAVSEEPVPSVLPEEGVDLMVEVLRYEHWLIDQALLRAAGNKERAAQILRLKRTTLVEKLQRRAGKRGPYLALRVSDETIARAVAASGSASKAAEELGIGVATVYRRMAKQAPATPAPSEAPALEAVLVPFADRIPWAEVADMRARGLREYDITRTIASRLGTHRFTIEKALRQPRPLAKCGP